MIIPWLYDIKNLLLHFSDIFSIIFVEKKKFIA